MLARSGEIIEKVAMNSSGFESKILVGGYPFMISENLWKDVETHGFAKDATGAFQIADKLVC